MLSARGEEYDKIHGFELGIDDYVVKPFSPKELMMRVKVVIDRNGGRDLLSITASNILIREVIPAKQTDKKKRTENSLPIGICLNTFGKVINIKDGPADGSIPKANTAGIIASAASSAAIVSKISVCKEDFTISSFFGR